MRYYTYKITFKDLPGYFYYGKHKDKGKPYYGTPVTWNHFWKQFEPEVQILQWYNTAKEVDSAEKAIIRATWDSKYSLNENVGGTVSEETCRKNGSKTAKAMNGHPNTKENQKCEVMNAHPNTIANRSNIGKRTVEAMNDHPNTIANRSETGKKNVKAMNGHPNTKENQKCEALNNHPNTIAARKETTERISKRIMLTSIATGESFEFPSGREACRVLSLSQSSLRRVVKGERKQHKGYAAVYL